MKKNTAILNNQDYREARLEYLQHWDISFKCFVRVCPICESHNTRKPRLFIVVRRTLRGMTIKCRHCGFQFSFTYHNFSKGYKGFVQLGLAEDTMTSDEVKKWVDSIEDMNIHDRIETRGRKNTSKEGN